MMIRSMPSRYPHWMKSLAAVVAGVFAWTTVCQPVWGQTMPSLSRTLPPPTGTLLSVSGPFVPVTLLGVEVVENNPLMMDFIVGSGQMQADERSLREETLRLVRYFLAALTTPEEDMWVNLSPHEPDRIVPARFGRTELGRDLLAEDYILKQMTSSLMHPDGKTGRRFWAKVYEESARRYGTIDVPVESFNRVWIVPDAAQVYEDGRRAFITKARMKVMLERDYLGGPGSGPSLNAEEEALAELGRRVMKEVIVPELEREVNEGRTFAHLRQMYDALVLAAWYRKNLRESFINQRFTGRNKIAGITIMDGLDKEKIYERYVKAFRKGLYELIREEEDPLTTEMIPRRYFAGGVDLVKMHITLDGDGSPEVVGERSSEHKAVRKVVVSFSPATHDAINRAVKDQITDIVDALGLETDEGEIDLRSLVTEADDSYEHALVVEKDGREIGRLWMKDGRLVVAADFGERVGAHYGMRRGQVYVNTRGKTPEQIKAAAAHEVAEAERLVGALKELGIEASDEGGLRQAAVAWTKAEGIDEKQRLNRQNRVMRAVLAAHVAGLEAERDALQEGDVRRAELQDEIDRLTPLLTRGALLSKPVAADQFDIVIQSVGEGKHHRAASEPAEARQRQAKESEERGVNVDEIEQKIYLRMKARHEEFKYRLARFEELKMKMVLESLKKRINEEYDKKLRNHGPYKMLQDPLVAMSMKMRLESLKEPLKEKRINEEYDKKLLEPLKEIRINEEVDREALDPHSQDTRTASRRWFDWMRAGLKGAAVGALIAAIVSAVSFFPSGVGVDDQVVVERNSQPLPLAIRRDDESEGVKGQTDPGDIPLGEPGPDDDRYYHDYSNNGDRPNQDDLFHMPNQDDSKPELFHMPNQDDSKPESFDIKKFIEDVVRRPILVRYLGQSNEDFRRLQALIGTLAADQATRGETAFPHEILTRDVMIKIVDRWNQETKQGLSAERIEHIVDHVRSSLDPTDYGTRYTVEWKNFITAMQHRLNKLGVYHEIKQSEIPKRDRPNPVDGWVNNHFVNAYVAFVILSDLSPNTAKRMITGEVEQTIPGIVSLDNLTGGRAVESAEEELLKVVQRFVRALHDLETDDIPKDILKDYLFELKNKLDSSPVPLLIKGDNGFKGVYFDRIRDWAVGLVVDGYEGPPQTMRVRRTNHEGREEEMLIVLGGDPYSVQIAQNLFRGFFSEESRKSLAAQGLVFKEDLPNKPVTFDINGRSRAVRDFIQRVGSFARVKNQNAAFVVRWMLGLYIQAVGEAAQAAGNDGDTVAASFLNERLSELELLRNFLAAQKAALPQQVKSELDALIHKFWSIMTGGSFDVMTLAGVLGWGVVPVWVRRSSTSGGTTDAVPAGENGNNPVGGIAFDPNQVRLIEEGTGTVVTLPDVGALKDIDFDGLIPVILRMQPVNIPALLGLEHGPGGDAQRAGGSTTAPSPSSAAVRDAHGLRRMGKAGSVPGRRGLSARTHV